MFSPRLFNSRYVPVARRPHSERRVVSYIPASQVQDEIDKAFGGLFTQVLAPFAGLDFFRKNGEGEMLLPRLDVLSDEKSYRITAELPGVKPEDVTLEVKDGILSLRGEKAQEKKEDNQDLHVSERSYGAFERVLTLPEDAVVDEIKASNKDGVLTIVIPRQEPEQPKAKTIEITAE